MEVFFVVIVAVVVVFLLLVSRKSNGSKLPVEEEPLREPAKECSDQWLVEWQKVFDESFPTKVHGVDQEDDGISRQVAISKCSFGDRLHIGHEKDNQYDPNALQVINWGQTAILGYLSRDIAKRIAPIIDAGGCAEAIITKITGGTESKPTLGVNVMLGWLSPEGVEEAIKAGNATRHTE